MLRTGLTLDIGVQADSLDVLHNDVHVVVRFDYVVDLQDVRMVDLLQDFDLTAHALAALHLLDLLLLVDLYRHFFVVRLVDCQAD